MIEYPKSKQCPVCGVTFFRNPVCAYTTWEKQKTCSVKCRGINKIGKHLKSDEQLIHNRRVVQRNDKRTFAYRYVAEQTIGRNLYKGEVVHHVNGNTLDDRPENLVVVLASDHISYHNRKYPDIKNCVICGAEFQPLPSNRRRDRTCGRECKILLIKRTWANKGKRGVA